MRDLTTYLIALEDAVWDKFALDYQSQEQGVDEGGFSSGDWAMCAVSQSSFS